MIEWIIFIVIAIISSEIMFLKFGSSDNWLPQKILLLFFGGVISIVLFGIPYLFAYGCNSNFILSSYEIAGGCVNHGMQVFFWYYGIIIGIVLFFWINKILLQKMETKKKEINNG